MNCEDLEYGNWTVAANFFNNEQEAKDENFSCQKCEKNFDMFELAWEGFIEEEGDWPMVWCQKCFDEDKKDLIEYLKEIGEDRRVFDTQPVVHQYES